MTARMRTMAECLAKADGLDRQASQCEAAEMKAEYLNLAKSWRYVAAHAKWQDSPRYANLF